MLTEASVEGVPARRFKPCRTMEEIVLAFSDDDKAQPHERLIAGKRELARLTGVGFTSACNWFTDGKTPPKYYLRIQNALKKNGFIGDPALLGME